MDIPFRRYVNKQYGKEVEEEKNCLVALAYLIEYGLQYGGYRPFHEYSSMFVHVRACDFEQNLHPRKCHVLCLYTMYRVS